MDVKESHILELFNNENIKELKKENVSKEFIQKNLNKYKSIKSLKFILENIDDLSNLDINYFYDITKKGVYRQDFIYLDKKGVFEKFHSKLFFIAYKNNNLKYCINLHKLNYSADKSLFQIKIFKEWDWDIYKKNKKIFEFFISTSLIKLGINKLIDENWDDISICFLEFLTKTPFENVYNYTNDIDYTHFFYKSLETPKNYYRANIFLKKSTDLSKFTDDEFVFLMEELTKDGDDYRYFGMLVEFMRRLGYYGFDIKKRSMFIFEIVMNNASELINDFINFNIDLDYGVNDNWLIKNMIKEYGKDHYYVSRLIKCRLVNYSIQE